MRKVAFWAVWVLLGAAGCARPQAPAEPPARAPVAPAPVEEAPAEPPALTAARLDAFLRYQRLRLEADAGLERETGVLAGRLEAGGAMGQRAARQALQVLERRAEAEERARREAGLSAAEVRHFGAVVRDVLRPRLLARTLALEETVRTLEEQKARLRGDKQAELEAQLAPLRAQAAALQALAGPRAAYGDAAVDTVLAREADLLRNHDELLSRLAGPSR